MLGAHHKELNDSLLNSFRNLCVSIREVIPERADELKIEHEGVFKEKIPIIKIILGDLRKRTPGERLGPRAGGGADGQQEACSP